MITYINKVSRWFVCAALITLHLSLITSCADEFDTSYAVEKPADVAATEQLCSYGTLLEYIDPSFRLGTTLTTSVFQSEGTATTLTMTNFNELTLSDAFLHKNMVTNDGTIDTTAINTLADMVQDKGINLFCGALAASTNLNITRLNALIAPELIVLDEQTGKDVWDFEGDALGTTYGLKKSNGDDGKGTAVVEDDPDGQSGHVLHISKTNQSFPAITLTFPDGRTLGDYKKISLDFKALNKTAVGQAIVLVMAGKSTEIKKPSEYGCVQGEWGRGLIEFNLEVMSFSDEQKAQTTVELVVGPKLLNCEYLIDNISLEYTYQPSYYEEKTPEEKTRILTAEIQHYVKTVVGQRDVFKTWTIADNPVTSDSTNFWKSNLGDTYFVSAVQAARQANGGVRLFVSEEQLTDSDICSALVAVVAKAEQQGVKIDGIDACVAIDADTDLTAMFKTLAATGKQIRLTILSVVGDTESAAAQSLNRAVTSYKQQVAQTQRYGISFAAAGESGTNAGLWTSGYNRKQTYASLIEALK